MFIRFLGNGYIYVYMIRNIVKVTIDSRIFHGHDSGFQGSDFLTTPKSKKLMKIIYFKLNNGVTESK